MTLLLPDLHGVLCAVDVCFEPADTMRVVTGSYPASTGDLTDNVSLVVPVCGAHSHLLRAGLDHLRLADA